MQQSRKGFTIIMAIWILVAMSSMMALMLSFTSQTLNQTTAIYTKEQAQLLSKSATEYALLAISGHARGLPGAGTCVNQINSTYAPLPAGIIEFNINTTIKYIGLANLGAGCSSLPNAGAIGTPESIGTVLIDTYVTSVPRGAADPIIRYHRRTIQKP